MDLLLALLACGSTPPPSPPPAPPEPAPVAMAGSIGGEPILSRPVVLGGLATDAVVAAIDAQGARIARCYEAERSKDPTLRGKVLVKFVISGDGSVKSATVRSTSLRHPPTETCLTEVVSGTRFPRLERGDSAIVTYPFEFPR